MEPHQAKDSWKNRDEMNKAGKGPNYHHNIYITMGYSKQEAWAIIKEEKEYQKAQDEEDEEFAKAMEKWTPEQKKEYYEDWRANN